MELRTLGYSEVTNGQLLTFYIGDEQGENRFEYVMLYALKDFNLSHQMALYYPDMIENVPNLKSEAVLTDFTERLINDGYVTRPANTLVKLGNKGRPPERIMQEYKFRLNPQSFTFERLKEEITVRSLNFFNHQGHYLLLMDASASGDELLIELSRDEEYLGLLHLGVISGDKKTTLLNDADFSLIKQKMTTFIERIFPNEGIVVERVMPYLQHNTRFRMIPKQSYETRSFA